MSGTETIKFSSGYYWTLSFKGALPQGSSRANCHPTQEYLHYLTQVKSPYGAVTKLSVATTSKKFTEQKDNPSFTPRFGAYRVSSYTKSGPGMPAGTWKYSYGQDATTVTGPVTTQVVHFVPVGSTDTPTTHHVMVPITNGGITFFVPATYTTYQPKNHYIDGLTLNSLVKDTKSGASLTYKAYQYTYRKLGPTQSNGNASGYVHYQLIPYQSEVTTEIIGTSAGAPQITNTYSYNGQGWVVHESLGAINGNSQTVAKGYFDKEYTDDNKTTHHLVAQTSNEVSDYTGVVDSSSAEINDSGYTTSSTHNGVTTTYTYGSDGNLATKTNAMGSVTQYGDYFAGFARKVTDALGHVGTYTVNPDGTIASYTDPEGHSSSYTYDYLDRVTKVTMPNKDVYTNVYSLVNGAQVTTTTHGSAVQTLTYNAFGKPSSVTVTAPDVPTYTQTHQYDAIGREIFTSYPSDTLGTATTYDGLGRVTATSWPVSGPDQTGTYSTTTSYPSWDKIEHTDANGHERDVTNYLVGSPSHNLSVVEANIPTSAGEQVTRIERDAMGRMLSVSQDGWTRTYNYDSHFWVSEVNNPETGITHYGHDAIGEVIAARVGNGGTTAHSYDKLGNLIETEYPDGRVDSFTYTPTGKKVSAEVTGTTMPNRWDYTFDNLDHLTSATLSIDGKSMEFSYDYDTHGFMTAAHYADGTTVEYAPDALGRPTKGGDWVNHVDYMADGHEKSFTDSSGVTTSYTLNDRHMVQSVNFNSLVNLSNGANNVTVSYDYDGNTNITQVTDTRPNHNRSYQYDGADWLVSGTVDGQTMTATYDRMGNLTKKTYGDTVLNYQYDSQNRLQSVKGAVAGALANPQGAHDLSESFTYDNYGDITSRDGSGSGLTYNDAKELTHAVGTNPATGQSYDLRYFYDAMGNRVAVEDGGKTHFEVFNQKNQMLYKQDDSKVTSYIYLNGRKIAESTHALGSQATPQTSQFFHNDLQGSVILKSTFSGNVIDPSGNGQSYLPFSAELNPGIYTDTLTGNIGEHIGFINKPFNSASGLAYLGARYYDPLIGRFMGVDPVGFVGGTTSFNRYAYANNNPMRYSDPGGRFPSGQCSGDNCPSGGSDAHGGGGGNNQTGFTHDVVQEAKANQNSQQVNMSDKSNIGYSGSGKGYGLIDTAANEGSHVLNNNYENVANRVVDKLKEGGTFSLSAYDGIGGAISVSWGFDAKTGSWHGEVLGKVGAGFGAGYSVSPLESGGGIDDQAIGSGGVIGRVEATVLLTKLPSYFLPNYLS